ncbi:MAG: glycosyltransferase family 39 protein [Chloroflexota bacterium]
MTVADSGAAASIDAPSSDSSVRTERCEPGDLDTDHLADQRVRRLALLAIVALGLAVRLWGIDWQLPWQFHPDEGHYSWKAMDLIGQDTLNPKYFRNPSLQTYLFLAEYRLLGFQASKADEQAATADGLFRPPSGVAFVARVTVAIFGALTVLALAWAARPVVPAWAAIVGGLFLALAFIHVRDSHYATNDVLPVLLLALSVGYALRIWRDPRLSSYLLAGLFGGLATSTKYNAGLFVVPLVVAHGLAVWSSASYRDWRRSLAPLVLAGVVAFSMYLAGTPYTVLDFPKWLADFRTQSSFVDEPWEGQAKLPPGVAYAQALVAGLGWPMLVLGVFGIVARLRQPDARRGALVLLSFPLAYLAFMSRSELFFVRFALPVVPFVCLFAGVGVWEIWRLARTRGQTLGMAAAVIATVVALIQPTVDTVRHNLLIAQEDTRVLAARWAVENVPKGAKMALEEYTIRDRRPRAYGGPSWQLDTDLLDVNQLKRADPLAPLRGTTRFVMISSFQQDRFGVGGPDSPQLQFYEALAQQGRVVARFGPGRDGQPIPFDLEDLYSPYWGLDRYERPGPTVTVYELPGR